MIFLASIEWGPDQSVDVVGKVVTDTPNGAGVGINGFGLQAFEFEVFQMQLIVPIKMRGRGNSGGSVDAGISSGQQTTRRCVAKSRLRIEGVRVQNKSWGGWWGILRVAASSNYGFQPPARDL